MASLERELGPMLRTARALGPILRLSPEPPSARTFGPIWRIVQGRTRHLHGRSDILQSGRPSATGALDLRIV